MGNLLPNLSDPDSHVQRKKPDRPPQQPKRQLSRSDSTDSMLDHIGEHLNDLQQSVKTLRLNKAPERKEQLNKMMTDTERNLRILNEQKQPRKKEGKSTFYLSSEEDEKILHSVLSENDKRGQEIASLKTNMEAERKEREALQRENRNLTKLLTTEREKTDKLETVNTDLLLRLSKAASHRLLDNNPAIADLTDRNRPTKLGEMYSELYDNEWTDALEALQTEEYEEEFAIGTLHLTLINVFDFCKQKSESMLSKTEDAVNFLFEEYKLVQETESGPQHMRMSRARVSSMKLPTSLQDDIKLQERWKLLKTQNGNMHARAAGTLKVEKSDTVSSHIVVLRKEIAESMVPVVQKAYTKASWIDGEFVPGLKPFIRKCIFLCWMMVVQSPPMSLHMLDAVKCVKFEKDLYKDYTQSGPQIQFVVWPALLLHENGPVITKGVAQGCTHS